MHILNLASGSKANCTLAQYGDTKILIDAGLSVRELEKRLECTNVKLCEISAVIITHEHSDHIKGLIALAKKSNINVFVHKKLFESGAIIGLSLLGERVKTFEENAFEIGEICVAPFLISHDAVCPVGFVLSVNSSKSKIGFVTDLGEVTETVKEALSGAKIVYIESNHDKQMLLDGYYPQNVKTRIAGRFGHLSNEQSIKFASWLFDRGTKCFILSHLSENNNTPELAYGVYADFFERKGLVLDKDVFIRLSFQHKCGNNITLKEEF